MFPRFTREARAVVVDAVDIARDRADDEVRAAHLLLAVVSPERPVARTLAAHGLAPDAIQEALADQTPDRPDPVFEEGDADALRSLGIDLDAVRGAVESSFGEGALDARTPPGRHPWWHRGGPFSGHLPFTAGAKAALELALRETVRAGVREIRGHDIALGLLRSQDAEVRRVLERLVTDDDALRADLADRRRSA